MEATPTKMLLLLIHTSHRYSIETGKFWLIIESIDIQKKASFYTPVENYDRMRGVHDVLEPCNYVPMQVTGPAITEVTV